MKRDIDQVAASVRRWRRRHPGQSSDLPTELQQQVVKLLEKYMWSEVCETVEVKRQRLASWRRNHREQLGLKRRPHNMEKVDPAFLELPLTVPPRPINRGLAVELQLPSGVMLRAREPPPILAVS